MSILKAILNGNTSSEVIFNVLQENRNIQLKDVSTIIYKSYQTEDKQP